MKIYKISKSQRATRIFRIAAPKNYQALIQPQNNSPLANPSTNVADINQHQAQEALQDSISAAKEAQALEDQAAKVEKETGQTGIKENVKNTSEQAIRNTPAFKLLSPNQMGYVTNIDTLKNPNDVSRLQRKILDNIKEIEQSKAQQINK